LGDAKSRHDVCNAVRKSIAGLIDNAGIAEAAE
jgi:hypothetical protein